MLTDQNTWSTCPGIEDDRANKKPVGLRSTEILDGIVLHFLENKDKVSPEHVGKLHWTFRKAVVH